MSAKLKPCPFCGSPHIELSRFAIGVNDIMCVCVRCVECGCRTSGYVDGLDQTARDTWNRRPRRPPRHPKGGRS